MCEPRLFLNARIVRPQTRAIPFFFIQIARRKIQNFARPAPSFLLRGFGNKQQGGALYKSVSVTRLTDAEQDKVIETLLGTIR